MTDFNQGGIDWDEKIILADKQDEVPIERDKDGNILAPKGLKHYHTRVTATTTFIDTFAYSKKEAEELAESSYYGGGGQDALENVDPDFDAELQTDDRAEVQAEYIACWDEEIVAEPRG